MNAEVDATTTEFPAEIMDLLVGKSELEVKFVMEYFRRVRAKALAQAQARQIRRNAKK